MSSYLVLARKYRPQNFSQLVGQEVLVRTLTNSIKNNRLHQAYMLHGIRGVGKTTTARIIAKSINCLDENTRSQGNCCCTCENCRLIANSHHQDVTEIDAASRTDVAGIREIIDSIAYSPVSARYKIYIIDEVHMLSSHAFNALLKTLEEPPAFVKFIFATTEIREVPQTILSRCQRFDLRRLDESEIAANLTEILQKEGFEAEKSALALIARASEGSVRDSLSILDQALANNNHQKNLSASVVEEMLGVSDNILLIELLESLLHGDFLSAQNSFNKIFSTSSDILKIANDLLEIIYKTACTKLVPNYRLDDFSVGLAAKIREISATNEISQLSRFWHLISKSISELKSSFMPKMSFEMLLVRICHLVALPDLKQVLLQVSSAKESSDLSFAKFDENTNFSAPKNIKKLTEEQEFSELQPSAEIHSEFKTTSNTNDSDGLKNDEFIAEILRSFEGSKIVQN